MKPTDDQVYASDAGIRIDTPADLAAGATVRDPQGRWWVLAQRWTTVSGCLPGRWWVRRAGQYDAPEYAVTDDQLIGWRLIPSLSVDNPVQEADSDYPDRRAETGDTPDPTAESRNQAHVGVDWDPANAEWTSSSLAGNVAYVHTYDIDVVAERRHADALAWALRGFPRSALPDWVDGDDDNEDFIEALEAVVAAMRAHPARKSSDG